MRVLITGATGFVGRYVTMQVSDAGHDVLAFGLVEDGNRYDSKRIKWLYGDMADITFLKPAIKSFDPEVVIHLAWRGIPDYSEVISRINLNDSVLFLDFIIEETKCKKIIVSGSCFEYGKAEGACCESDPVTIISFFSWAKYSLYQYLLLKCSQKKVELIWFRIFYVYGPHQRGEALIPSLVRALKDGKKPEIRSPLNKNDFVYIEDVATAFALAVDAKAETGIYNLGCGIAKSVYNICKMVEKHFPISSGISDYVLIHGSKEGSMNFSAATEKTARNFGWHARTTLEEGVSKYIESLKRKE